MKKERPRRTDKSRTLIIFLIPALGGTGVLISGIVNPNINSVKFLFWVSIEATNTYLSLNFKVNLFFLYLHCIFWSFCI